MKIILLCCLLTGCASVDKFVCYGTGTCVDGTMTFKGTQAKGQFTPQTIQLNGQSIIIIPEYSSGRTQAILVNGK